MPTAPPTPAALPATTAAPAPRPQRVRWSRVTVFVVVGIVAVLLLAAISIAIGTGSLADVWHGLFGGGTDTTSVLVRRRVPRAVLAILVGAALGVAGVLVQAITRNPLADPGILGINSGAYLAVVLGVAFLGTTATTTLVWVALVGACIASLAVFAIGMGGPGSGLPSKLVLAGVAIGAICSGVSFSVSLLNSEVFDKVRFWSVGSLQNRDWDVVLSVVWFIAIGLVVAMFLGSSLNALALGDDLASALGTRVGLVRGVSLGAITLLCGAATAAVGPITFLGLLVPHAVRSVLGPDHRVMLAVSIVVGPFFMLLADILGRLVPGAEVPVGVVMSALGAPVLIILVRRSRAVDR